MELLGILPEALYIGIEGRDSMNSPAPFGFCPICTEILRENGDLLECPAEDYRAPKNKFLKRWDRFHEETVSLVSDEGFKLADQLLKDLQEMNIKRIQP